MQYITSSACISRNCNQLFYCETSLQLSIHLIHKELPVPRITYVQYIRGLKTASRKKLRVKGLYFCLDRCQVAELFGFLSLLLTCDSEAITVKDIFVYFIK